MASRGGGRFNSRRPNKPFNRSKRRLELKAKFGDKTRQWQTISDEIKRLEALYTEIDPNSLTAFADFPLSERTQKGLADAGYKIPTDIQKASVFLGLQGNDILGAAKTGSGKTIAFLIPVLECLFRLKWNPVDGLGALIITPTRELAYQIFEVLRKVGKHHDFSAGLVIGGKHVREEADRIRQTNIVICTPGRLLQHMDETVNFNADNLQMLVLDEADRILDMGFQQTMNAIIENLPTKRQTLLFSATQTKSVKDLARLSLKDPMYVSVHENAKHSTPAKLEQSYMVCELHEKMDVLWSFIKNHLKSKILIFLSCCKQVRFIHECFKRLRPGVTILCLHGAMQQLKRVSVYEQFCRKQHAVLFATDIAARGLDFPAVHWVVQLDCPDDANTYIHRAGRTARFEEDGEALLVLTPSEEDGMVAHLKEKKIPISKIKVNPKRLWSIQPKLESLLAADVTLKEFGQRSFVSYVRSVFLASDKKVFDIEKLDTDKYAHSLGLAIPPRIRFLQKEHKRLAKQQEEQNRLKSQVDALFNRMDEEKVFKDEEAGRSTEPVVDSGNGSDGDSEEEDDTSDEEEGDDEDEDEQEDHSDSSDDSSEEDEEEQHPGKSKLKPSESKNKSEKETKDKKSKKKSSKSEGLSFDVGDDDLDDLLVVKKVHKIEPEDENESEEDEVTKPESNKKKKEKPVTKFAQAKKLQKMNIVVNTKVVFDDEGEVVEDKLHKPQIELEDQDDEGGINIAVAKRRMQQEDKIDKQIFRERIKAKHREERLKEKEKKRKQKKRDSDEEEEQQVVLGPSGLGSDEEGEEEEEEEEEEAEEGSSDDDESDDEDDSPPAKKVKKMQNVSKDDSSSEEDMEEEDEDEDDEEQSDAEDDENEDDSENDASESIQDAEALALKLLG